MQWVAEESMPLSIGQSSSFVNMINVLSKTVVVPDYKGIYDILYSKKVEATGKLHSFLNGRFFPLHVTIGHLRHRKIMVC